MNRGDSFRRRRSRSNSLAPEGGGGVSGCGPGGTTPSQGAEERPKTRSHKVAIMGAPGVGKTALLSQFQTSECINAYDRPVGNIF